MSVQRQNDVVGTLMDLEEGETVSLEAQYYEWSPFTVDAIEEVPWTAPEGDVWIAKHIELEPVDARGSPREFDVYPHASPPFMGKGYGVLTSVVRVDEEPETEDEIERRRCPWLDDRDARDIVSDSPVSRTLEEVLDAVERQETVLDVHKRIASGSMTATRDLLWQLGLRDQAGRLLEDDVLQERVDEMREVFVDA